MPALNIFQYKQCSNILTCAKCNAYIIYRTDLHSLQAKRKKLNK